jgi:hypothetical protein
MSITVSDHSPFARKKSSQRQERQSTANFSGFFGQELKGCHRERRKRDLDGMRASLPCPVLVDRHATVVPDISSTIVPGVSIENFLIKPRLWNTHAIPTAHDGGGIYHEKNPAAGLGLPEKRPHGIFSVAEIDPLEPIVAVIAVE